VCSSDLDRSRRLFPGERDNWDDVTVNFGFWAPWTRGGDECSKKYGVRLARFQLLLRTDAATDYIYPDGWAVVLRFTDAYRASDAVAAMMAAWTSQGFCPRECVHEGGIWKSDRMMRFLTACGVEPISAKGRPNQKLVEGVINRFHTQVSLYMKGKGYMGRFRGSDAAGTRDWLACRAGKKDPRTCFPSYEQALEIIRAAIAAHNRKPITSRVYGDRWVPEVRICVNADKKILHESPFNTLPPPHISLRRLVMPVQAELTLKPNGVITTMQDSPDGDKHQYAFAARDLFKFAGKKVIVQFDPERIDLGAFVSLVSTGEVIAECVQCISRAPQLGEGLEYLDPVRDAVQIRKASRSLVGKIVKASDSRESYALPAAAPDESRALPAPKSHIKNRLENAKTNLEKVKQLQILD
jgi:hypothetical protein